MPNAQLKRVERLIAAIETDPKHVEKADTLEALRELCEAIRSIEARLKLLENTDG